ncbi:beta-ketoacyl-ACP reductase [Anaerocolumna cellulosilytica]|uniref:3-oxoacyl-[acyl-carrier-protein] reductase n=1 Tax=Anaerocolumna cellulosilytica TaxID=433286 RepID=A0A6S6RAJ5_9FIRM|nr:3-oxoacyl-[acyl-carrier-protein] reductase [Anaerocolumna cellulosilytica]MBB5195048.1 3-oxoacyl-[acyl-carrier protein] reductase [Anaerocolumna cellulosilytica]BCJ96115.1 beta-ketoacyl-ACP reductase [Anaerocolumna cellulosilytica]
MLTNRIALVTGASRGIGRAIAITLAGYGATVIVNYNGSKEKADEVVEEIVKNGGKALAYQADVADFSAVQNMFADLVKQLGRIDILINNAGITRDNLILKMSEEEFDQVIDTNLKGVFNCLKQAARLMLKQKQGRIVNISSISGVMGNAGQINYSASKAGVIGMTKSLAKELGSRGITVNAIAPGYIKTDMTAVLKEDLKEKVMDAIPLRRLGEAEEIAEAAAFLVSDKAAYITGQTIQIDGGLGI